MFEGVRMLGGIPVWALLFGYVLGAVVAAVAVRNALRRWLDRTTDAKNAARHEALTRAIPRPAGAAVFLLMIGLGLRFLPLPLQLETLTKHVFPFVLATTGVSVAIRVALRAISAYGDTYPQLESTGRAITWIVGLALIAVLISDALGISLAPALTALGVGSLSVALALQDTLSNFFSGVYLLIDRPIRPGDFVRLDGGYEGYVDAIGWRSTHLRTLAPSTVIVPNSTLSRAVITNFGQANPRLQLATAVDVAIDEDPAKVEAAFEEVARGATEIAGVEAKPAPFVRFAFDERGLVFTVYVTVNEKADSGLVQQEVRRRAIARLRKEQIALAPVNPFGRMIDRSR